MVWTCFGSTQATPRTAVYDMEFIEFPGGGTYTSWVKLEEQAEALLVNLTQHTKLVTIDDHENVHVNSIIIFDTGALNR